MANYVRPRIDPRSFIDENGEIIDYGNRWVDGPPEDSYSVKAHLERFEPLHTVANALLEALIASYDVAVEEGLDILNDLADAPDPADVVRVVRLTPRGMPARRSHSSLRRFRLCACNAEDVAADRLAHAAATLDTVAKTSPDGCWLPWPRLHP